MRVAVFSTRSYDRQFLDEANEGWHELAYHEIRLTPATAAVAAAYAAVCAFVNDQLSEETLSLLQAGDMQILYHPGTLLVLSFLLGTVIQRASFNDMVATVANVAHRLLPVLIALIAMLGLSRIWSMPA